MKKLGYIFIFFIFFILLTYPIFIFYLKDQNKDNTQVNDGPMFRTFPSDYQPEYYPGEDVCCDDHPHRDEDCHKFYHTHPHEDC